MIKTCRAARDWCHIDLNSAQLLVTRNHSAYAASCSTINPHYCKLQVTKVYKWSCGLLLIVLFWNFIQKFYKYVKNTTLIFWLCLDTQLHQRWLNKAVICVTRHLLCKTLKEWVPWGWVGDCVFATCFVESSLFLCVDVMKEEVSKMTGTAWRGFTSWVSYVGTLVTKHTLIENSLLWFRRMVDWRSKQ